MAGIAIDMTVPLWRRVKEHQIEFPPSEHHVPERFGLFTIIVLGEAILAAVTAAQATKGNFDFWITGLLGLFLAFSVWWIYFEGVKGSDARVPSSRKDIARYQLWLYSHFPLQFAIVGMAVGVKLAMEGEDGAPFAQPGGAVFVAASFLCMLSCHLIYLSSLDSCLRRRFVQVSWPYMVTTAATPFIGLAFLGQSGVWVVGAMTVMFLAHVFLTLRETRLPTDPPRHGHEFTA
jgi:low temperature requirement protein LtrA